MMQSSGLYWAVSTFNDGGQDGEGVYDCRGEEREDKPVGIHFIQITRWYKPEMYNLIWQ